MWLVAHFVAPFWDQKIALVFCWLQFQQFEFFELFIRFSFCNFVFFHDKIMFCMTYNVILLFSPSLLPCCGFWLTSWLFVWTKNRSGALLATVSALGAVSRCYRIDTLTFPIFDLILLDFEGSPWGPHFPLLDALIRLESPGPLLEPPGLQKWSILRSDGKRFA